MLWNSLSQVLTFPKAVLIWWEPPLTRKQPLKIASILWQRDKNKTAFKTGVHFYMPSLRTCVLFDNSSQSQEKEWVLASRS